MFRQLYNKQKEMFICIVFFNNNRIRRTL